MRAWPIVLVALGCGRVSFDERGDGGDAVDAADDAGAATPCNLIARAHDTFSGPLDTNLWGSSYADTGTSYMVTGGEAVLTPDTASMGNYTGIGSYRHYDLRGGRFSAEVTQVATNGAIVGIQVQARSSLVIISESAGTLYAARRDPVYMVVDSMPYSADTHRFWGISESAGTLFWETSVDGTTFTPFAQLAVPLDVSLVRAHLFAGTESVVAAPGALHVSSVGDPAVSSPACAPDVLGDAFATDTLGLQWQNSYAETCCTLTPSGGRLVMTTDGSTGYAFLRSSAGYDLRGHEVSVELVQPATQAVVDQSLVVAQGFSNAVALVLEGSLFNTYVVVNGVPTNHFEPQLAGERFFRIREAGGSYFTEASTDRQTWRTVYSAPVPFSFDDVTFGVEAGNAGAIGSTDTVIWDNFNAP